MTNLEQQRNIPKSLFRYRSFNSCDYTLINDITKESISQERWKYDLIDGFVFASCPSTFNDPYDSDLNITLSFLRSEELRNDALVLLKRYVSPSGFEEAQIMNSNNLIGDLISILIQHSVPINPEFNQQFHRIRKGVSEKFKNTMRVACFSESNDSVLMWSHYSYHHTGFCIEYDFSNHEDISNRLKPVNYSKHRICASDRDVLDWSEKLVLTKSKDWCYEDEWRFVFPLDAESTTEPIILECKENIKAIYFGAAAENTEKNSGLIEEVIKHYRNKDVTLYRMRLADDSYRLIPEQI